jgi:voltage-gated potassium channel
MSSDSEHPTHELHLTEDAWHHSTDWPMMAAALAFLVAYAFSVLAQPSGMPRTVVESLMYVTWFFFAVDYAIRLYLAEERGKWFLRNWYEFAIVVLPLVRPLKLLRLVTLVGVFQRSVGTAFRGRVVLYAIGGTGLLIFVSSLAVLEAERNDPASSIKTFADALWWAAVTVTTVGYGDFYPVTHTGRLIALGLMTAGIALLGVITATLASWMIQRVAEQDERSEAATRAQVADLSNQIQALRTELAQFDVPRRS